MKKKGMAILLSMMMVLSVATASAAPVKHERVFAVLGADGAAATVLDNVHLENVDGLEVVEDVTELSRIENVSGNESFTLDGNALTWQTIGGDITYRGVGEKPLPVTPMVRYTLDGSEIPAAEVIEAEGRLEITVSYTQTEARPMLAVTLLPIPDGASNLETEDAVLLSEGGKRVVLGLGVPGADETLELPASFRVSCDVQKPAFEQMLTVITDKPLTALAENVGEDFDDADTLIADATALFSAMQSGEALPESDGKLGELARTLTELTDGVTQLKDGMSALYDGTVALSDGAAALQEGLGTLTENSAALNDGAAQIFATLLQTANAQIADAGLDALGIALPELTAENYSAVLEPVIAKLSDASAVEAQLLRAAQEKVAAAVEANDAAIREAVTQAAEAKVLAAVLGELKLPLSVEDYAAAVQAGSIPAEQDTQIRAAVSAQMQTEQIAAALETSVKEQKDALIAQNMESDEVQGQLAAGLEAAQNGAHALSELKAGLDSVNTFVTGLAAYTDGVGQAATGAAQLNSGAGDLQTGALQLKEGILALHDGLAGGQKELADKLLPWLTEDVAKLQNAARSMRDALNVPVSYDMVKDGMEHDLMVFVRTEMNR